MTKPSRSGHVAAGANTDPTLPESNVSEGYARRWADHVNLVVGAWLVIAPLSGIGSVADRVAWNSYLVGLTVALLSLAALARPRAWKPALTLGFAVWLIAAPAVLGFRGGSGPGWNHAIAGVVVGINAWRTLRRGAGRTARVKAGRG
jgi:hypothetical protein